MLKKYTAPNSPELWDKVWRPTSVEQDQYNLRLTELDIVWEKISKEIEKHFGSFENLVVIEVGSGGGTTGLLFGRKGSKVTVLDYSTKALERAQEFYKRHNIEVNTIYADALNLPKNTLNQYDVSLSFGLAEHFENEERINIIKSHKEVLKSSGITFISVPNKWCPPYRIFKFVFEFIGKWKFGLEVPFLRKELIKISNNCGFKNPKVFGSSFYASFGFVNPMKLVKHLLKTKKDIRKLKRPKETFLDDSLGYAIILKAEKP